jgi:NAD(P)-dependent dehydrogenase (short-subunit alcohol dehydrogenase family)
VIREDQVGYGLHSHEALVDPKDDLGYVAVFLASIASSYLTGQIIYVDGGWPAS